MQRVGSRNGYSEDNSKSTHRNSLQGIVELDKNGNHVFLSMLVGHMQDDDQCSNQPCSVHEGS